MALIPDAVQRNGTACSFACVADPEAHTVTVLAAPDLAPIRVEITDGWTAANAKVRHTIAEHFGIPPQSFGFHEAPKLLLRLLDRAAGA